MNDLYKDKMKNKPLDEWLLDDDEEEKEEDGK